MKVDEFKKKLAAYGDEHFEKMKQTIFASQENPGEGQIGELVLHSKDHDTIIGYVKVFSAMAHSDTAEITGRVARLMYKFGNTFGEELKKGTVHSVDVARETAVLYLEAVAHLLTTKQGKIGNPREEESLRQCAGQLVRTISDVKELFDEKVQQVCSRIPQLVPSIQLKAAPLTLPPASVVAEGVNPAELIPATPFVVDMVPHAVSDGPIDLCPVLGLAARASRLTETPIESEQLNDIIQKRLPAGKVSKDPASMISVNGQRYVLSSCPKTMHEASEYVSTVIEHGGTVFVSLLEDSEAKSRYNNFWSEAKIKKLDLKGWKVVDHASLKLADGTTPNEKKELPYLQETTVTLKKGDEKKKITHLHYNKWRDHKPVPDVALFDTMMDRIQELRPHAGQVVALNCRGGVGRSGETISGLYLRSHIKSLLDAGMSLEEIEIDIPAMISDIRLQRPRALTSAKHLRAIYGATARYCEKLAQQMIKEYTIKQ